MEESPRGASASGPLSPGREGTGDDPPEHSRICRHCLGEQSRSRYDASQGAAFRLAALMAIAGTLHFVQPSFFDRSIPPVLPGRARTYTHAFGVAAYALSAALAYPRTRRVGATLTAAFYVAVVPAKVQLTVNWLSDENAGTAKKTLAILHLPWQGPLVTEALKARRNAAPGSS